MIYVKRLWQHFLDDNLFRNSIYLMLNTGTMGALGFFFWLICTRIFTPEEIGVGTTLISAMSLISFVSLLGFNTTFVRFLPTSSKRNSEINTGSILVMAAAALISLLYILFIPYITPGLGIIRDNIWYSLGFILMVALASLNSLTDSIFIAYRAAQYAFITDGIVGGLTKLLLPFVFLGLGAYGVFAAAGLSTAIGMIASVAFLYKKFGYKLQFKLDFENLKDVFHYSFTNYIANLFAIAPTLILPIIIINNLGSAAAGYYYLAFMVINILYTVSSSVAQSLFAEGSYGDNVLRGLIKRSIVILAVISAPAGILLAIFGPYILEFFGKSYSAGGSNVIVTLALGSIFIAAYNISSTLLRIRQQMYSVVAINVIYAVVICGLTLLWVGKGLVWVAIAWIMGNVVAAALSFVLLLLYRHLPTVAK